MPIHHAHPDWGNQEQQDKKKKKINKIEKFFSSSLLPSLTPFQLGRKGLMMLLSMQSKAGLRMHV